MTLAARVGSRDNNFDVLRLLAAALVLVSHSWALSARTEPSFAGDTLGGLGVTIFFAISGFLVARSWHMDPRPAAFVVKRVLRLWPALLVVLVLTATVLGPAVTDLSMGAYFDSSGVGRYILSNGGLHIVYDLPGVFTQNPYPQAVNGSLWTLPIEVKAYVVVLVLGMLTLLKRPLVVLALLAATVWMLVTSAQIRPDAVARWLEGPLQTQLTAVFIGAVLLHSLRDRIRLDWRLALAAALVAWLTRHSGPGLRTAAWACSVPYLIVYLAFQTPAWLRIAVRGGDLSYGIYLWAFPVQQTLMRAADGGLAPGWLVLFSAAVTSTLAWASWRLIEAPALRLKPRLHVRAAPRPTPALAPNGRS